MVRSPYPILGLETVLFSLFLPSRNHNLHAGMTPRMMRCTACISLHFGSGWLVIYFSICSCTFIICWLSILWRLSLHHQEMQPYMEYRPKKLLDEVRDAIRVKHYARNTEQACVYCLTKLSC